MCVRICINVQELWFVDFNHVHVYTCVHEKSCQFVSSYQQGICITCLVHHPALYTQGGEGER